MSKQKLTAECSCMIMHDHQDHAVQRRLKPLCSQPVLIKIYKSLILAHLDYCSAVWGGIGAGLSKKLEKLQNRAARIITGANWDVRCSQILSDLNWTSLADRKTKQMKSLMLKNREQTFARVYIRKICEYEYYPWIQST